MKSSEHIEDVLERFGSAWPDDASIVERVMRGIESTPARPNLPKQRRVFMKSLIGIAASLAACFALWWTLEGNNNSLYAQVIEAARNARTIHMTYYGLLGREAKPVKSTETWYEKGVGFRRDVCDFRHAGGGSATTCLGHGDDVWTLDEKKKNTIIHSHRGITKETDRIFADIDRHARDLQNNCQRYPEGDQTFNGQPCKAYLPTKPDRRSEPGTRRQVFYLDQQSRLVRVVSQERKDDYWNSTAFSTIAYDEPFDPALFQPNFGKDFTIVEADAKPAKSGPTKPEGPVLVYEADPNPKASGAATVDMDKLLRVVDMRLNGGAEKLANVRKLDDRRIEVALLRQNDADRQRAQRQLTRPGTLEFRVLANKKVDKALMDRVQKEPAAAEILDPSGKRLAWWVPIKAGEDKSLTHDPNIARRTKKQANREITEILVVADPYNVTGDYLTQAQLHFDPFGGPRVGFTFNDAGGELFGKLTGDHLPNDSTGLRYKLGIIIDGELLSAPAIMSKIGNRGEITGSFTEIEASDLAAVLNAGSLPARLRLVNEHP
jgi:hypothetical protein